MNVQVETLENSMAKLTVEVDTEKFEKALDRAYNKQKKSIQIPGFRKGKAPRKMVEKMYGEGVFFEDAANILLQETYPEAYEQSGLDIVSQPAVDIVQIEAGKEFIYTAEVAVRPEVTLGKYKGITVTKIDTSVGAEEVDAEIEKQRNSNSRTITVERPVEEGDTAVIDFEGFVDDVAFEGGKGENYNLVIGSHQFIDTFEEQLIGKSAGEETEVSVTFPEDYQAADLAGKPAVFKVKINEVKTKELPELDDEFAQDVSEFDTLAEYRADVEKKLQETKETEARRTKEEEAVQKIIDGSKMDMPEPMIDGQVDSMVNEFANNIAQQGLSFEQYMQFTGMTVEKFREQVRPDATKRIQSSLVLGAIAKEENIEVSDEDVDAEITKMAESYGMEADQLKGYIGQEEKDNMKKDLAMQKALDLVMDNVKERAKAKKAAKKAEEQEEQA
jgi:trigger factor